MIVDADITIDATKAAVWNAITDLGHAADFMSGIEKIEILERPADGLVGLKWRETRILFGKPAAVEKWITDAVDRDFYKTRAESDGFVFVTTMTVSERTGDVLLTSSHASEPQSLAARLSTIPMRLFFKGVIRKAILQDLNDIKAAVEQAWHSGSGPGRR